MQGNIIFTKTEVLNFHPHLFKTFFCGRKCSIEICQIPTPHKNFSVNLRVCGNRTIVCRSYQRLCKTCLLVLKSLFGVSVLYHTSSCSCPSALPFVPISVVQLQQAVKSSLQRMCIYLHRYPAVTSSTNYACAFSP